MKFCLSLYDLLLPSRVKVLKDVLEIKEQTDEIRSIPPAVFFEKAVLKIFRKLEKHSRQSSYSTYLQTFNLVNMLNTIFLQISAGPQISTSKGVLTRGNKYELFHSFYFIFWTVLAFNTFMPDGNKSLYTLKQSSSWKMQFCLSLYGNLVSPIMKGLIRFMFMASL